MKRQLVSAFVLCAGALFAQAPKNVIIFIGDGMSVPQRMVAEEFSRKLGDGSLAMNTLPFTACASAWIFRFRTEERPCAQTEGASIERRT